MSAENVDTGLNFVDKAESWPLVRFVRITYVRAASAAGDEDAAGRQSTAAAAAAAAVTTANSGPSAAQLAAPSATSTGTDADTTGAPTTVGGNSALAAAGYAPMAGFGYRTFVPAAVKVGMCSGAPEYESFTATWERSKAWLKCIGESTTDDHVLYRRMMSYKPDK